ncbi:MAG: hypothetical protein KF851_00195 [Pirellulaceae bacterium]|nr:hypothetical protein [Pirellulaceae bacterium]
MNYIYIDDIGTVYSNARNTTKGFPGIIMAKYSGMRIIWIWMDEFSATSWIGYKQ